MPSPENRRYHDQNEHGRARLQTMARDIPDMKKRIEDPNFNGRIRIPDHRTSPMSPMGAMISSYHDRITHPSELPREVSLPFQEIAEILRPKCIDLAKELDGQAHRELMRGHIAEGEVAKYKAQFEKIYVDPEELNDVSADTIAMLFVDNMGLTEAQKKFTNLTRMPFCIGRAGPTDLQNFQKVNPHTERPLKNQNPSGRARLTFIINGANSTKSIQERPGDNMIEEMKKGKNFLQPQQWFELFLREVEEVAEEMAKRGILKSEIGCNDGVGPWKGIDKNNRMEFIRNWVTTGFRTHVFLPNQRRSTRFSDWRNPDDSPLIISLNASSIHVHIYFDHTGIDSPRTLG